MRPITTALPGSITTNHPLTDDSPQDNAILLAAEISRLQRRVAELEAEKAYSRLNYRQLESLHSLYQAIPGLLPDTFIVAFYRNLKFTLAEGPLLTKLGYKSADIVGLKVTDRLPDGKGWRQWEAAFRGVLKGQAQEKIVEDQGSHYRIYMIPVKEQDGSIGGGLQITQEITSIVQQQVASDQRSAELAQTNQELNRYISTNLELEQFAYIAAHDLKEPIRTIISFSQLLQRRHGPDFSEEGQEFIEYIVQGSRRMEALITGLLDYSSLDKRGRKEMEKVSVHEVLEGVLRNLGSQIQERKAEIIFGELPVLRGDAVQLAQLFQNLVSNGIKFNTSDQPVIHIDGELDSSHKGDHWRITVQDNGIGIPADGMDKIFGIFRRLHNRDEYEGAGIGLAVCKKIVERHGGRIWAESSEGKGTHFVITLPRMVKG